MAVHGTRLKRNSANVITPAAVGVNKTFNMTYKAIMQLTSGEADVFKSAVSQLNNLMKALPGAVEIELVCHGRSFPFLLKENNLYLPLLNQLICNKVAVVACENMLQANNIPLADLAPGVTTVRAAIAELVVKQQQGWSYIKAGF